MDEISLAIGELTAQIAALAQRQDALHAENIARHTETIERISDMQAQLHELKHAHNNERVVVAGLAATVTAHQRNDERDHRTLLDRLDERRLAADREAAKLEGQLAELFAIKYRILGGFAVVAFLLMVFGHTLWGMASHLWSHWNWGVSQ